MSYAFTATDLGRLQGALETLLSPAGRPDGAAWPGAACAAVQRAVDVEGFTNLYYVRGADPRPIILHTTVPDGLVAAYNDGVADQDEVSRQIQLRRLEVAHPFMVADRRDYLESALYRDFFVPHRIGNYLNLLLPHDGGPAARLSICSPALVDEARLARGMAVFGVLLPAFRAGFAAWRQFGAAAPALPGLLDAAGGAVAVCDRAGRVRHESTALGVLLAARPPAEAAAVREAVGGLARAAGARLLPAGRGAGAAAPDLGASLRAMTAAVHAGGRTVALHAAFAPEGLLGEPAVLVTVRDGAAAPAGAGGPPAAARAPDDDAQLRARYGLTAQEAAVARLMAARRTDAEVGAALGISPHTARTHAERVRRKLGVSRRGDVAAALAGAGAPAS